MPNVIKALYATSDGQGPSVAVLGLTQDDVDALTAGQGIVADLAAVGLPSQLVTLIYESDVARLDQRLMAGSIPTLVTG